MRHGLLCDELDDITHSYDYGIVPGSATVFVKDELNNIGRLDLTLLEGVMIVVEVSEEGYKIASCSPLSNSGSAITTAQIVQKNLEIPFETMDNLLMAVSPMFRERFQIALYDKLESVHRHQQHQQQGSTPRATTITTNSDHVPVDLSHLIPTTTTPTAASLASTQQQQHTSSIPTSIFLQQPSSSLQTQSQHQQNQPQDSTQMDLSHTLTQDVLDDLHNWIH